MNSTASITIRRLDPRVKQKLKSRAAAHGRSMEAEARDILTLATSALSGKAESAEAPEGRSEEHWLNQLRRRLAKIGYLDGLETPARDSPARPVDFSGSEYGAADEP